MPRYERNRIPLPSKIGGEGLLIGWSMEARNRRLPIGFAPSRSAQARPKTRQPLLHTGAGHLMTIAPTGAGKGVGAIVPALLRHRGPVIVVDPKGENYAVTARRRREMGQQVVLLDPFAITAGPAGGFNPLDLLVAGDPDMVDDAAMLAELLVPDTVRVHADPFWSDRARQAVRVLMMGVALHRPPVLRNVGELFYLLHQTQEDMDFTMREFQRSPAAALAESAAVLRSQNEGKVQSSYFSVAQDQLACFGGSEVAAALSKSSFDPAAVTRGDPLSIYIVIPPDRLASHRHLLRLWIGSLFALVLRRPARIDPPTLFLLDEAAQLGPLPQLRQALTLLRGYGLQCWSFWQDLSQLQRLYPRDWSTMYNNCAVHQAFGVTNMGMARALAGLNRVHAPQTLLELEPDEMELCLAGMMPVIAQRPDYLADPVFRGLYDPNPFFAAGPAVAEPADHPARTYDSAAHEVHPSREELAEEIEEAWTLGDLVELEPEVRRRLGPASGGGDLATSAGDPAARGRAGGEGGA